MKEQNIFKNSIESFINKSNLNTISQNITTELSITDVKDEYMAGSEKISTFLTQIETYEQSDIGRKWLFLNKIDPKVITLMEGFTEKKVEIKNLDWAEIKTLLYKQLIEVEPIDLIINMRENFNWLGLENPLIFCTNFKNKYDIIMAQIENTIDYKDPMIKSLTQNMDQHKKQIFEEMLRDNIKNIGKIETLFLQKGREFFFKDNEQKTDTTKQKIHHTVKICQEKNTKLTPYQGRHRSIGEFCCNQCYHKWTSRNSWANFSQNCQNCEIEVFPHRQYPLEKPYNMNSTDPFKKHPYDFCGKCKNLGISCRKII